MQKGDFSQGRAGSLSLEPAWQPVIKIEEEDAPSLDFVSLAFSFIYWVCLGLSLLRK
jgi:hypothetical protein